MVRGDLDVSRNTTSPKPATNGTSLSPLRKTVSPSDVNGMSPEKSDSNGTYTNGASPSVQQPQGSFYGHDREEVTRILIQSLGDLGYHGAARSLVQESGYELESPSVAAFRSAILRGEWAEAEALLHGRGSYDDGGGVRVGDGESRFRKEHGTTGNGLTLAEGGDEQELLFWIRQQKFMELLESKQTETALHVLRQEITPLHRDVGRLHALSSLMMCQSVDDLKRQAQWDGAGGRSRQQLLSELTKFIAPSAMIPEHRLAVLFDQVKNSQISACMYHNTPISPSLYTDHTCDRENFPLTVRYTLRDHTDEVFFVKFSNDGGKLASMGKDTKVLIYETRGFKLLHTLEGHVNEVAYAAWSPDDTKLVSCSKDRSAKLWDTRTGKCLLEIEAAEPVTSAAWLPNGESFVTATLDSEAPLSLWDVRNGEHPIHTWKDTSMRYRFQDCAISPDGQRLVAVSNVQDNCHIRIFSLETMGKIADWPIHPTPTSLSISGDSRFLLINFADNRLRMLDIETCETVKEFRGQKQGHFVIRGAFGGATENFVISGSEDSRIHIWHKLNGKLVESIDAHAPGCVNAVSWNPTEYGMWASAGDDKTVKIWMKAITSRSGWNNHPDGYTSTIASRVAGLLEQ